LKTASLAAPLKTAPLVVGLLDVYLTCVCVFLIALQEPTLFLRLPPVGGAPQPMLCDGLSLRILLIKVFNGEQKT
jgi:hypothetical protein